jgi:hypothetical protein
MGPHALESPSVQRPLSAVKRVVAQKGPSVWVGLAMVKLLAEMMSALTRKILQTLVSSPALLNLMIPAG